MALRQGDVIEANKQPIEVEHYGGKALRNEQRELERAGRLHWFHWLVVLASLLLTLSVWQYSKSQVNRRAEIRFEGYANQVTRLIADRLQRYEDGLQSGVAAIRSHGGAMSFAQWREFANALNIGEKYPGINGIGVIQSVPRTQRAAFEAKFQAEQPGFQIKPEHGNEELMPIVYIVPVAQNAAAVGLDMAHEANRYQAADKSRASGQPQITGPIVLVQDAEQTPGFLFYAPYYSQENPSSEQQRLDSFSGLVYAPFVVKRLLEGTLDPALRVVGITIHDGDALLYDENVPAYADYDPNPLFKRQSVVRFYGRDWRFDIWARQSFRESAASSQPMLILAGGILLDSLLLTLFLLLTRANRKAVNFANRMSKGYKAKAAELARMVDRLETSNEELEQFAYIASHDLQEPLRTLSNYSRLLERELEKQPHSERVDDSLRFINSASQRMRDLVSGLLFYSRIGHDPQLQRVNCIELLTEVMADLGAAAADATVRIGDLPVVMGYQTELRTLFQNLIANALKFRRPSVEPVVIVTAKAQEGAILFSVQDNGMGIKAEHLSQVFRIFTRLNSSAALPGSGIGLANCRKVVTLHGGKIWVESEYGKGSTFYFTIPDVFH